MDQEYKRRLEEAAHWEEERRARVDEENRQVKVPNMARMPLGCWLWIGAVAAGIYYLLRGCGS